MKKLRYTFLVTFSLLVFPVSALAAWKPAAPTGYSPISWVKAPGIASFFKAPTGNGSLDFITRIYLPENQIRFIVAPSSTPQDWGVSKSGSFIPAALAAEDDIARYKNFAFPRIAAEAAKGAAKTQFIWNGPFFNITTLTSDLSLAIKTVFGTSTLISSGSRPDTDMAKPRKMLLINNAKGTARIVDFDQSEFVSTTSDVALEAFAPSVALSDNASGVAARLFLGISKDGKELVIYCSQNATIGNASSALSAAGIPVENQLEADGGGSATCGYNLPGHYFVEPTRTLPLLMGAVTVLGRGNPTTDGLNVRSGPGTKFTVAKKLNKKDVVTVYEEKSGWYRIGEGVWVSKSLIKKI